LPKIQLRSRLPQSTAAIGPSGPTCDPPSIDGNEIRSAGIHTWNRKQLLSDQIFEEKSSGSANAPPPLAYSDACPGVRRTHHDVCAAARPITAKFTSTRSRN